MSQNCEEYDISEKPVDMAFLILLLIGAVTGIGLGLHTIFSDTRNILVNGYGPMDVPNTIWQRLLGAILVVIGFYGGRVSVEEIRLLAKKKSEGAST